MSQAILKPLYFGGQEVPADYVFIARRYVFAMVNPKPVTDGHVLICPTRQVKSMQELTELETLELFACAKEVVVKFEDFFKVKNFMFLIQDGTYAGKKESGVYLQLIPREDQKQEIQNQFSSAQRIERKPEHMGTEATRYRELFAQSGKMNLGN